MSISKSFAYHELAVRVGCTDQAQLTWLEEFLAPSFSVLADGAPDATVWLEIDARDYESVLRCGPRSDGRHVAAFAFDRGLVHLPVWDSRGDDHVIFDPDSAVFYFVSPDGARARILSASAHPSRRITLMRVVREFAMSSSWTSRRFVLHAGACELANSGIIIAGPKGAGKTTLLMYALDGAAARYIANDRVVVDCDGPQVVVRGMPTVVSVRQRTLRCFPAFERRWASSHYNERLALHEVSMYRDPPAPPDPINLTPAQFCALLGVSPCGQAPVRLLLFPRLSDDIEGIRLQELSPETASQRLAASVFAVSSPPQISQVFALPSHSRAPDRAMVDELSRMLIAQVRSFDCQLGWPAPYTAEAVKDFLGPLLLAPPTPLPMPAAERRA